MLYGLRRLSGLSGVGDAMGLDPARVVSSDGSKVTVSGVWIQRAVNAANGNSNLTVDGIVGPHTWSALNAIWLAEHVGPHPTYSMFDPHTVTYSPQIADPHHMLIDTQFEAGLAAFTQVADPPGSVGMTHAYAAHPITVPPGPPPTPMPWSQQSTLTSGALPNGAAIGIGVAVVALLGIVAVGVKWGGA